MEDDVLVNFDGFSETILHRFDAVRGNASIVLGVEPFCWLSRECTLEEMAQLYPAATNFSRCPAFINSGVYIGEATPLLGLLAKWVQRAEPGDQERLVKEERDRLDDDAVELGVVRLVDDSAARLGPRPLLGGRAEGVLEDEVLHQVRLVVAARSRGRDV